MYTLSDYNLYNIIFNYSSSYLRTLILVNKLFRNYIFTYLTTTKFYKHIISITSNTNLFSNFNLLYVRIFNISENMNLTLNPNYIYYFSSQYNINLIKNICISPTHLSNIYIPLYNINSIISIKYDFDNNIWNYTIYLYFYNLLKPSLSVATSTIKILNNNTFINTYTNINIPIYNKFIIKLKTSLTPTSSYNFLPYYMSISY